MYNPMLNPKSGQERLNEILKEAEVDRRNRSTRQQISRRSFRAQLRALIVKSLSAVIR